MGRVLRILIDSAPPWAPSGYGLQCGHLAGVLAELGHEVAVSAFGGCHAEQDWNGTRILPTGTRPYGNGVIAGNYRTWRADAVIILADLFVTDVEQLAGLNVIPWVPVDCDPLGVMDERWLARASQVAAALHPVAMSEHGARMLAAAGFAAPVIGHATTFAPDPEAGRRWRRGQQIPDGLFLVAKVGVNNEDDRKAFGVSLPAFAEFARGRGDVGLYCHAEAQAPRALNLAYMARQLGLAGEQGSKVVFPDEYMRAADRFGQEWMAGLYNAADVVDAVSRGEGFGCPIADALACGTPVITSRNSACAEKIAPGSGWLVGGQREWARHHHAWWQTPSAPKLASAYRQAYVSARTRKMRDAAARAGQAHSLAAMRDGWKIVLEKL